MTKIKDVFPSVDTLEAKYTHSYVRSRTMLSRLEDPLIDLEMEITRQEYKKILDEHGEKEDSPDAREHFYQFLRNRWQRICSTDLVPMHAPDNKANQHSRAVAHVLDSKRKNSLLMPTVTQNLECFNGLEPDKFILRDNNADFIVVDDTLNEWKNTPLTVPELTRLQSLAPKVFKEKFQSVRQVVLDRNAFIDTLSRYCRNEIDENTLEKWFEKIHYEIPAAERQLLYNLTFQDGKAAAYSTFEKLLQNSLKYRQLHGSFPEDMREQLKTFLDYIDGSTLELTAKDKEEKNERHPVYGMAGRRKLRQHFWRHHTTDETISLLVKTITVTHDIADALICMPKEKISVFLEALDRDDPDLLNNFFGKVISDTDKKLCAATWSYLPAEYKNKLIGKINGGLLYYILYNQPEVKWAEDFDIAVAHLRGVVDANRDDNEFTQLAKVVLKKLNQLGANMVAEIALPKMTEFVHRTALLVRQPTAIHKQHAERYLTLATEIYDMAFGRKLGGALLIVLGLILAGTMLTTFLTAGLAFPAMMVGCVFGFLYITTGGYFAATGNYSQMASTAQGLSIFKTAPSGKPDIKPAAADPAAAEEKSGLLAASVR